VTTVPSSAVAAAPVPAVAGRFGLPAHSGSGRRIVYDRGQQRVWVVDGSGNVIKTHRVSGQRGLPRAGTYRVFSRSISTYSKANPAVTWRYMVRFAHGPQGGNIGFHEIPTKRGNPLQSTSQLGQPLSAGCVRQSHADAVWMWNFAGVGTKVVVL
jgi:lipoprotein-anchoring transpeptidase ErfK/SrfK